MNNPFQRMTEHEAEADEILGDRARAEIREVGEIIGKSGSDLDAFVSRQYAEARENVAKQIEAGTYQAVAATRKRVREILTHTAAADRPELARYLALETDTPAAEAIKQLSTAPADPDAAARFILEAGR